MSKGNPVLNCRISPETLEAVEAQLAISAVHRRSGPYTVASFIESAVIEKLRKMKRSAGRRGQSAHVGRYRDSQ
jgi:hypothetical protein